MNDLCGLFCFTIDFLYRSQHKACALGGKEARSLLDDAQLSAGFEQMDGETVTEHVRHDGSV